MDSPSGLGRSTPETSSQGAARNARRNHSDCVHIHVHVNCEVRVEVHNTPRPAARPERVIHGVRGMIPSQSVPPALEPNSIDIAREDRFRGEVTMEMSGMSGPSLSNSRSR